jgi:hypothetical protein
MGRLDYEDWVPEEDRNRFFCIEQSIGELEANPVCREASPALFWQVFYGLKELTPVIQFEAEIRKMESNGYSFDEAFSRLSSDENRDVALLALLRKEYRDKNWQVVPDSWRQHPWITLEPAIFDRIFDVLLGFKSEAVVRAKEDGQERLLSLAFAQLHLATALLRAISRASWENRGLVEDLISLGDRAFNYLYEHHELYGGVVLSEMQALELLTQAGYYVTPVATEETDIAGLTELQPKSSVQEQREQSLCAVMSMYLNELFKTHREQGRNEEALSVFAVAVALWARSTSALEGELNVQAAVGCCENIFLNKSVVRDWKSIANACCLVLDNLAECPDSNDLLMTQEVLHQEPWTLSAVSYWQRARTRAEIEASPPQYKQLRDLEKQSYHINRLKNDFLEDLTNVLEPESLRALVQAEIAWYESQSMGGRSESTANELRHVFERELAALIFERARESINSILQNRELRKGLNIESRNASRLSLREMAILLTEAGNDRSVTGRSIRELIEHFPISPKDKGFLYVHLPRYLHGLSDVRRASEHPGGSDAAQLRNTTRVVRREALGIGDKGYLVRLLTIKKAVSQR